MAKADKKSRNTCAHCKKPIVKTLIPGYHENCAHTLINERLTNMALDKVTTMRLKMIKHVTFARSEDTNYESYRRELRDIKFGREDVVMFLSLTQNQVAFVYPPNEVETSPGVTCEVLRSVRLRLRKGRRTWNPYMLANYAADCGIKLDGIKRFEDHFEKLARESARQVAKRLGVEKELRSA